MNQMNHIQLMRISYVLLIMDYDFHNRHDQGQSLLSGYREFFNEFDNRLSQQTTQEDFEEIAACITLCKQKQCNYMQFVNLLDRTKTHNVELTDNYNLYKEYFKPSV